jgi:N-methylhydantoinase B
VTAVDPTTLAVVRGYLEEVVDEMDLVQQKAALSPIVSENGDRSNGLFRLDTGETIAQGQYGSPIFITTMQHAAQGVLQWIATIGGQWNPGDVYLLNDPFIGGTHLQDAKMVTAFYWDDQPELLLANTGHWMDVGAAQAGAFGPTCRSIYEEGLRIPPMRVATADGFDAELIALIRCNNRLPEMQVGDLHSQRNALAVGVRRLETLFARYGSAQIRDCIVELQARSERDMRSRIRSIPDGEYVAEDALDNDGISNTELPLRLVVRVSGDRMAMDFTGTAPACEGPMNLARSTTITACYTALKHLLPEIPINGGCFVPVDVIIPAGCLLDAQPPHAVGGYVETAGRVVGLVGRALASAIPDTAAATSFGTGGVAVLSGYRDSADFFVGVFPYGGGYGASRGSRGLVNGTSVIGMAAWPSIEASEREYPILWNEYGVREGSGGSGEWPGGCGNVYDLTVEAPTAFSILGDQVNHAPGGVLGGRAGAPNDVQYTLAGDWHRPELGGKLPPTWLAAGDRIAMRSPGGGGFGDPSDRAASDVADDVIDEYLSATDARAIYGWDG